VKAPERGGPPKMRWLDEVIGSTKLSLFDLRNAVDKMRWLDEVIWSTKLSLFDLRNAVGRTEQGREDMS